MKKLFLTLTALCAMSTAAWAADDDYTGGLSQGAVLQWKLPYEGGTMIIFGDDYNPMNDFIPGDATFSTPWSRNNDLAEKIQAINMQKGINIGKYAFSNLPNLESISIHGVGTNIQALFCIGDYAFANSPKLATINSEILSELRYIGAEAFKGTAIKSFTIDKPVGGNLPKYLTTEQGYGIDLNREHCYIGANAFAACDHLTTLYMKDDTPFADTYNNFLNDHTYLVVDNADVAATFRAAWDEIAGQVIYLAQSVTFENETFKDICISNWDTNGDGSLSYEEAFAVTSFGDAFKGNTELKEITLSDLTPFINVTIIGSGTFEGCTALEKITFPSHIEDIADDAFTGCTSLKEIHFTAALPFKEEFTIQTNDRTHIIVPDAYLPTYDATWTNKSELIIGESHIPFQCTETKRICVTNWDTDKDGELSYTEAAKVTDIKYVFKGTNITSFDELKHFVKLSTIKSETPSGGRYPVGAFNTCNKLTSITIPQNITHIMTNAFNGCSSLKEVILMDGSQYLTMGYYDDSSDWGLFESCPLEHVYLGRNILPETGQSSVAPFLRKKLKTFTIGNGIKSISQPIFNCGIQEIHVEKLETWLNLTYSYSPVADALYLNGQTLTDIVIPNTTTSIRTGCFNVVGKISSIIVPASVTSIGGSALGSTAFVVFESSTPITYNNFSQSATYIVPDDAVATYRVAWPDVAHRIIGKNSYNQWTDITCNAQETSSHLAELIGEGNEFDVVKLRIRGTINSYDMMVMRNKMQNLRELDLTDATIVANTYDYGTGTSTDNVFPDFMKGKPLTNILLPTSITSIGANALNGCKHIKEITIPDNVTTISSSAFSSCSLLSSINVSANSKLQTIGSSAFLSTTSWKNVDFSQAQQLELIGEYAFESSAVSAISLPTSLKTIGNYAFKNCTNLLNLSTVANIGNYAFENCTSLTSFASVANIGNYAFKGCSALQSVTIGEGATTIGEYAFQNLKALKTVTIENGLTTINKSAFYGCYALQSISLPESLTSINADAFNGCTALKEITLPDALTSLGNNAFKYCKALEKAEIGMGITSVPQYLFSGCTALKEVKMSPKTTTIQSYAFQDCNGLTEVHLPPYLTTIQSNAFSGCSNLKEIYAYMPDVPTIAASTFSNYLTSTLYAPAFLFNAYYYDSGWNQFLYVKRCDLRPGDFEAFYTNKDLLFKEGEERITADRPIVELGAKGSIIVEGANQEFTTVDMLRGASTSSSLIGDDNIPMDELRVKVEVSANRWYFLCFPYDVNISECTYPGKYAWRYYDGATRAANGNGGWQKIEGTTLKAGVGYIFQSNTAGNLIVKFAEPEFGGDRPTTLTAYNSTNAANASWNFVGNPYACYYNFESDDFASPITVWNGSTYVAYRPGDDDYHLQPYEAFFVQKTEDASAINFGTEGRETYSQSVATATAQARARRQRGITPERLIVNLTISDNDTAAIDRTRYVMNDKASRSYELACDASKFISDDAAAQLYTLEGSVKMAINERPGQGEVRIGYTAQKAGTLRIEAQRMDFPMELIDTKTDRTFDLSKGAYEFTTEAGTFDNRFVMRASRAATEIMNLTAATGVAIGMQEGGLSIGGAEGKSVSIYAANGALVAERSGNGYVALAAGTYVVKVDGHSAKMYVK